MKKTIGKSLVATVTGTIKNYDRLEKFNITIKISDKALTAAGYEWTETGEGSSKSRTYTYSAEKAYIALPEYAVDMDGRFLPLPSDPSKTTAPKTISAGIVCLQTAQTQTKRILLLT